MTPVSARRLAPKIGIHGGTLNDWARKGRIPFIQYGKQRRYDPEVVVPIIEARRTEHTSKTCSRCGRDLPLTEYRHRAGGKGVAADCTPCHKAYNRELRIAKAVLAGRRYHTREEMEIERAHAEALRIERARCRSNKPKLTPKERTRRAVERQRIRYQTDPEFHAKVKAKKIRRKRAVEGAFVEAVNRETVANRDGWRCSICGGKVTRRNWSLEHVVPLYHGGAHSYANVTIAHRSCNSRRGAGRIPSQAPLFATLGAPSRGSPPTHVRPTRLGPW